LKAVINGCCTTENGGETTIKFILELDIHFKWYGKIA